MALNWRMATLSGWGRTTHAKANTCAPTQDLDVAEAIHSVADHGIIAYGSGRSYGDAALNDGGQTILTSRLNQVHSFDPASGEIVCGPGVTFNDLLRELLPQGFLVPVSPGTGFASIGGAVANDVHGKNHDNAGSFGDHVLWIELLLPSGELVRISQENRPELFAATIGGVGLTGVMLAICFRMKPVSTNAVALKEQRIKNLDDFFSALEHARNNATYSVGWIDAMARGDHLGRGVLETAELATSTIAAQPQRRLKVPMDCPGFVLNSLSIRAFNHCYYHRIPTQGRQRLLEMERFLYPLDAILEWNRIYGRRGFFQLQCVFDDASSAVGIRRLLEAVSQSRAASFLAVLKTLGGEGQGYLSFPKRGYTLALDFPHRPDTEKLLAQLESITLEHGGRIYLAKDACLSPQGFESMYPKLDKMRQVLNEIDPEQRMMSDLARRLHIRN